MALTPASAKRRFVLRSAVLLVSASVLAVLLTVAGERSHARYDLTATRQHALSPRTKQILASASRDYEIAEHLAEGVNDHGEQVVLGEGFDAATLATAALLGQETQRTAARIWRGGEAGV